jgi:hypothetical protein
MTFDKSLNLSESLFSSLQNTLPETPPTTEILYPREREAWGGQGTGCKVSHITGDDPGKVGQVARGRLTFKVS